ncbi:MAG: hypothetical protein ACYDC8_13610 [Gammaproteobacteria bacterium]
MNWLNLLSKGSNATVDIVGHTVEVTCSASAVNALARRDRPLIVELELAFACFARKQVYFHETSTSKDLIPIDGKLALLISTIVPDTCAITDQAGSRTATALRSFMPKWIRLDYVKGAWVGEYGL